VYHSQWPHCYSTRFCWTCSNPHQMVAIGVHWSYDVVTSGTGFQLSSTTPPNKYRTDCIPEQKASRRAAIIREARTVFGAALLAVLGCWPDPQHPAAPLPSWICDSLWSTGLMVPWVVPCVMPWVMPWVVSPVEPAEATWEVEWCSGVETGMRSLIS
jgi:hypothetical protein